MLHEEGAAERLDPDTPAATTKAHSGVVIDGVSKSFGSGEDRALVLDGLRLTIARGEFVSLIGPSGCGKSTLLKIVAGLMRADEGRVAIDGESVAAATRDKLIGLVPQSPALLPWRTVLGNVRLPVQLNRKANSDRALRDPEEVLRSFGLGKALKRYPAQLSGGMQQRVAIARAFVFDPGVLLMDEPFSALDELNRDQQRFGLLAFWQSNRKAVLFVTHSVPEAVMLSDRIVVMSTHPGRIHRIIEDKLPRPRDAGVYEHPDFHRIETEVRSSLREVTEESRV
jgi:NitT/TauT family transport system ATP-binding protein